MFFLFIYIYFLLSLAFFYSLQGGGSHVCDLCGSPNALLSCAACHTQSFCAACDDMYHKHPRRSEHVRKVTIN
jgi:hypothetical protein